MNFLSVIILGVVMIIEPSLQSPLNRNGKCFYKTWQCYGAHTSKEEDYWMPSRGPLTYVDGQETATISGHVSELEYVATITGVPVRFFIMELDDTKMEENKLKITHSFTHTANKTGLIKIPLDLLVRSKSRIGFEVASGDQIPMNHRPGKTDGTPYTSFIGTPEASDKRVFPSTSVNQQYNFRICFDLALNEVLCPSFNPVPIIHPCTPNPCVNGECDPFESEDGYRCRCDRGFKGKRCDEETGPCYRKFWQCHGGHTSLPEQFTYNSSGNMAYVDGQSTTTISGHMSEIEYVAAHTGVEVRFTVMELARSMGPNELEIMPKENVLKVVHKINHVADRTGLIKIPVDWEVRRGSRIGFEVFGRENKVPIRYRIGKPEGGHYRSFIGLPGSTDTYVFPKESVNRQYNFRMCFDLARDEVLCPYNWDI